MGEYLRLGVKPRRGTAKKFVRGPIPLDWLSRATALTPSAALVAVALAYQRGLAGTKDFRISPARFRELGIQRTAQDRGLKALVEAGLVKIEENKPGRAKTVVLPW